MPVRIPAQTPVAVPQRGVTLPADLMEETTAPEDTSETGWGPAAALAAGGAGLLGLGAGLVRRNPKAAWEGAKKVGRGLGALRQQSMLSGLALPKSVLGNIGATAVESAERGTMKPLRELFSMDTLRDIKNIYKTGGQATQQTALPGMTGPVGKAALDTGTTLPGPMPGRIMGAVDEATRNALGRAGLSPSEAERAVFQAPLPGKLGEALDNPVMRYLIPFRRTPFNQLIEGGKAFAPQTATQLGLLGGSGAAGAAHGAATVEEKYPMSVGLGAAAAAKYGLPYSLGALAGRYLAGGDEGGLASTAVPVSEYGVESGVFNALQPFSEPAGLRVLRRMAGE